MTVPAVTVVVPTIGGPGAAATLAALDALPEADLEVVVALDGPEPAAAEPIHRLARVSARIRLVELPVRSGRAAAVNAAVAASRGEVLVLLDDDMAPSPGWLEAHLRAHRTAAEQGRRLLVLGAAPARIAPDAPGVARYLAGRFDRHLAALEAGRPISFRDVYTGNASLRRADFLAVGGFDERFREYGNEDGELAIRLREAGVEPVYEPAARASQRFAKDLGAALRDARGKGRTAALLARLHPGDRDALAFGRPVSRRRRLLRAPLVVLARVRLGRAALAAGVRGLERIGLAGPVVYRAALDAEYLAGVAEARRVGTGGGPARRLRRLRRPVVWGTFRRLSPLSDVWGRDRGTPVDRYLIERFLERHARDVRGRVLEVADRTYTDRIGLGVAASDVLDLDPANPRATIVGDLVSGTGIPVAAFDCCVITQTLQYVADLPAAIATLHRALAPGGVVLATIPTLSRIGRNEAWPDYWRLTPAGARLAFERVFGTGNVEVEAAGNVLLGIAFLAGVSAEELRPEELETVDPAFPILALVRGRRPDDPSVSPVSGRGTRRRRAST